MIQLHNDYLLFKTASGETIPCSVERVTIELVGEATSTLNPELVRQAAAAVLHYFKHDLGMTAVTIADFSLALERVLKALGFTVRTVDSSTENNQRMATSDLRTLVCGSGTSFELAFFVHLRDEVRRKLETSPEVLKFQNLRGCVKLLLGAKRWNNKCQDLNDQIVVFLRDCFMTEAHSLSCDLMIR